MNTELTSSSQAPGAAPGPAQHLDGSPPTGHRAAAGCGIAFAVLLFVAVASVEAPRAAPDAELRTWWADAANLHGVVASTFAFLGAGLCFVVFAGYLQARLRTLAPGSLATAVIGPAGAAFVAMSFLTGAMGALARGQLIDGEPVPGSDLLRYLPQIRYTAMGAYALPAAALVIAAVSYLVLRHGGLPAWTGWLGVVCVLLIVAASTVYLGQLAIPALLLWAICVSIVILVRPVPAAR